MIPILKVNLAWPICTQEIALTEIHDLWCIAKPWWRWATKLLNSFLAACCQLPRLLKNQRILPMMLVTRGSHGQWIVYVVMDTSITVKLNTVRWLGFAAASKKDSLSYRNLKLHSKSPLHKFLFLGILINTIKNGNITRVKSRKFYEMEKTKKLRII